MTHLKRFFTFFVFAILVSLVVVAQEDDSPAECDYGVMGERLVEVGEGLAESDDPAAALRELQSELSALDAACSGLSFSSEEYGLQPAIGPFVIPAGVYRITAATGGYMITEYTALEGCEDGDLRDGRFLVSSGEADDGAQVALRLDDDCEVLMVVSNTTESWTIEFEKLR